MINISLILLNNQEKIGGLFDFDGTLPLTIFQFFGLMFILEKILYQPLSEIGNIRAANIDEKTKGAELAISVATSLSNLYNSEVSTTEKKIDLLLKQDDSQLKEIFQTQLSEMNQSSMEALVETEQDINKKISELGNNNKAKNVSMTIASIIISQIIAKSN